MTEGPAEENCAWRLYPRGILSYNRNTDRRDAVPLDLPLDQPHGLITDSSAGRKQGNIDGIFFQEARNIGRGSA